MSFCWFVLFSLYPAWRDPRQRDAGVAMRVPAYCVAGLGAARGRRQLLALLSTAAVWRRCCHWPLATFLGLCCAILLPSMLRCYALVRCNCGDGALRCFVVESLKDTCTELDGLQTVACLGRVMLFAVVQNYFLSCSCGVCAVAKLSTCRFCAVVSGRTELFFFSRVGVVSVLACRASE